MHRTLLTEGDDFAAMIPHGVVLTEITRQLGVLYREAAHLGRL